MAETVVPSCWGNFISSLDSLDDDFLKENENHIKGLYQKEYDRLTSGMIISEPERQKALIFFADVESVQVSSRGIVLPALSVVAPTQSLF